MNVNHPKKLTLRQRQAQATREMIIAAAQELFWQRGYTSTTIEAIAEKAGVAVSTVYTIFGSKRKILRAIREAWHERSHIRAVALNIDHLTEPELRLDMIAEATRQQWETGAEVMAIYVAAAAASPEAAAELNEALAGRRQSLDAFTHSLKPYLKSGLSVNEAAAILRAFCLAEVFNELVKHSGWSVETYQSWLAKTLKRELLGINS